MSIVIVPDSLSEAIYKKIDEQLEKVPEARSIRKEIFQNLLNYYNEHGVIPDFTLELTNQAKP